MKKDIKLRIEESISIDANNCWNWTGTIHYSGYGSIGINGTLKRAHRVSYETFVGPIPPDLHCLHSCDNPACVNPDHLWLGTNQENISDKVRKGRHPRKLTEEQAREIKYSDTPPERLMDTYKISRGLVSNIRNNRAWTHIHKPQRNFI
jgi:hypothetical protein